MFSEELPEFAEQVSICRMRQGNTELQSDAQRKFCAMLWEICPWRELSTRLDYGEQTQGGCENAKQT